MLIGLDPIVGVEPHILILGSMPSATSLEKQEYYGFKHNRFWKIMAHYYQQELLTYSEKCNLIQNHHIALWDVIGSCEREGSLDTAIRKEKVNDLVTFLKDHPSIQLVICNGTKSAQLYEKHFANKILIPYVKLPSTSNANRTISEKELYEKWFLALNQINNK